MIIDSNIFLEALLKQDKFRQCLELINDLMIGKKKAIISSFSIDSIIISLKRNGVEIEKIRRFLQKILQAEGLRVYTTGMKDRFECFKLIEKYKLDYDDAIIVQTAIATENKEIISFDRHFDKVKEIKRIEP